MRGVEEQGASLDFGRGCLVCITSLLGDVSGRRVSNLLLVWIRTFRTANVRRESFRALEYIHICGNADGLSGRFVGSYLSHHLFVYSAPLGSLPLALVLIRIIP